MLVLRNCLAVLQFFVFFCFFFFFFSFFFFFFFFFFFRFVDVMFLSFRCETKEVLVEHLKEHVQKEDEEKQGEEKTLNEASFDSDLAALELATADVQTLRKISLSRGGSASDSPQTSPRKGSGSSTPKLIDSGLMKRRGSMSMASYNPRSGDSSAESSSPSNKGEVMKDVMFCRLCTAKFDESEHEKKLCTNCTKHACKSCVRTVRLKTYGEDRERLICLPCIEDVKRKILMFKSVGRGTGLAAPPSTIRKGASQDGSLSGSPSSDPGSPMLGSGRGRGTARRNSIVGRGSTLKKE